MPLPELDIQNLEISAGGSGKRRRIDRALTVLPQPDSPTRARVSPLFKLKLIPFTAVNFPLGVEKEIFRF